MKHLLQAQWVATMSCPPFRDGAVVFDQQRILDVGLATHLCAEHPDAQVTDAADAIILPGLVNPHVHLELSNAEQRPLPPDGFVGWIKQIIARIAIPAEAMGPMVRGAIDIGVAQCLRFGVTTVGDISRQCAITRPLLAGSPLRVVSYGEVQAMAQRRRLLDERLAAAIDETCITDRLRIGITPHAPYTVESDAYSQCVDAAQLRGLPLATHLAETADEAAFLADHSGPLRELWNYLGFWDDQAPRFAGGPIRLAHFLGLLQEPTLLAHVNYCDDDELGLLAAGRASVVYCPRTHRYFEHPPHRWRDMLAHGMNVAAGTDSCASSPDLNLVDNLRLLHQLAPEVAPLALWAMATIRAARAIGVGSHVGSIQPGKRPDFAVFPVAGREPLAEILENSAQPRQVWIDGSRIALSEAEASAPAQALSGR